MYATAASAVFNSMQDDTRGFSAALDFALSADEILDLYNNAPCGYHSLDTNGHFRRINNTALRWLGYTRDELVGQLRFIDLLTPESQINFQANFPLFKKQGWIRDLEFTMVRKDGSTIEILLNATATLNAKGEFIASRSSIFDITARKKAENALKEREWFIDRVVSFTPDLVYVYDAKLKQNIFANQSICSLLGYAHGEVEEVEGSLFEQVIHPEDLPRVTAHVTRILTAPDDRMQQTEFRVRHSDGSYRIFASRDSVFQRDAEGQVQQYLGIAQDVTEQREAHRALEEHARTVREYALRVAMQRDELEIANRRLEALATTDGLTGLLNHRAFQDQLRADFERAQQQGAPLSLILLDVDYFKQYNDSFGHPAGDEVLKAVAEVLRNNLRGSDSPARYGGEEFAVILPNTSAEAAVMIGERIRHVVEMIPDPHRAITASIGVSSLRLDTPVPTLLIGDADGAMYQAKRGGRNCVRHSIGDPIPERTPENPVSLKSL